MVRAFISPLHWFGNFKTSGRLAVELPDAPCKNTGHVYLSIVPDQICVVILKRHRENRDTMSIVKPQLLICPYFHWFITFRCVCDMTIAQRIASTTSNKLP